MHRECIFKRYPPLCQIRQCHCKLRLVHCKKCICSNRYIYNIQRKNYSYKYRTIIRMLFISTNTYCDRSTVAIFNIYSATECNIMLSVIFYSAVYTVCTLYVNCTVYNSLYRLMFLIVCTNIDCQGSFIFK